MSTPTPRTHGKKAPIDVTAEVEEPKKELRPEDYIQLFDKNGQVLFTSNVEKNKDFFRSKRDAHFIENIPAIIRAAHEADVDLSQLSMRGTNLAGVDFRGLHLAGIDFSDCNFNQADLRNAYLAGCDLSECTFDQTRLTGADLTGAILNDTSFAHCEARYIYGLIMLDELNDYFVYGYPRRTGRTNRHGNPEEELRIKAGCRDFSLAEARAHWSYDGDGKTPVSGREEIWAALPLMEVMAQNHGWLTTPVKHDPVDTSNEEVVAGDGPKADPADVGDEEEDG